MPTAEASLIEQRPALAYLVLVFAISWGAVHIALGPGGLPALSVTTTPIAPLPPAGVALLSYVLVWAAVLYVAVGAVAAANAWQSARQLLGRRAAGMDVRPRTVRQGGHGQVLTA